MKGTYFMVHAGAQCASGKIVGYDWKIEVTDPTASAVIAQNSCSDEQVTLTLDQLRLPPEGISGLFAVVSADPRLSAAPFDLASGGGVPESYSWAYCASDTDRREAFGG